MARIGVFICHCGENIGKNVDCAQVAQVSSEFPNVVVSRDIAYTCSEPGQAFIRDAIAKYKLTGVVIGSCSPRMHEQTFRHTCAQAGLNAYQCEIANLREQCSWVHSDREKATPKAIDLVRGAVAKVSNSVPLSSIEIPITKRALIIGAGISGIQCALDLADSGIEVTLVERNHSIGGHMAQLSETFPTLDCSQCILTPRMVEALNHPLITLETGTEVTKISGYIGNFEATLHRRPRFVDWSKCTGCGTCVQNCPQKLIPNEFDEGLGTRTAISLPFPQAIPSKPTIDSSTCLKLTQGKCGICAKICPIKAIDYQQTDLTKTIKIGAIVVATGFQVLKASELPNYSASYGNAETAHPNVLTSLQFERLASASGPTQGRLLRPSDNKEVQTIAFVQCAGSRDKAHHKAYCSKICCMYTAKHASIFKSKVPKGKAWVMCMDVRTPGKGYEEFYRRTAERDGIIYLRSRVSRIDPDGDDLILQVADILDDGRRFTVKADMVILATASIPDPSVTSLAQMLGISHDSDGWFSEAHPKLRPVESSTAGIFLAGACSGPKDIPESVAQASAVASKIIGLFSKEKLQREPYVAKVNRSSPPSYSTCIGCFACQRACPYNAIDKETISKHNGQHIQIAKVNPGLCQGCGTCVSLCPSHSIELEGYTDRQICATIDGLLSL